MSPQEAFDKLVAASLAGMFPARDLVTNMCQYRTSDGRKCAIGVFIPDEKYDEDMEGRSPLSVLRMCGVYEKWMTSDDADGIQDAHDYNATRAVISRGQWNHERFVIDLLKVNCFRSVKI